MLNVLNYLIEKLLLKPINIAQIIVYINNLYKLIHITELLNTHNIRYEIGNENIKLLF